MRPQPRELPRRLWPPCVLDLLLAFPLLLRALDRVTPFEDPQEARRRCAVGLRADVADRAQPSQGLDEFVDVESARVLSVGVGIPRTASRRIPPAWRNVPAG